MCSVTVSVRTFTHALVTHSALLLRDLPGGCMEGDIIAALSKTTTLQASVDSVRARSTFVACARGRRS
jgi:hypothetical protein